MAESEGTHRGLGWYVYEEETEIDSVFNAVVHDGGKVLWTDCYHSEEVAIQYCLTAIDDIVDGHDPYIGSIDEVKTSSYGDGDTLTVRHVDFTLDNGWEGKVWDGGDLIVDCAGYDASKCIGFDVIGVDDDDNLGYVARVEFTHTMDVEDALEAAVGFSETWNATPDMEVTWTGFERLDGGRFGKKEGIRRMADVYTRYEHRGITYVTMYDDMLGWCYSIDVEIDGADRMLCECGYFSENEAAFAGMAKVDSLLQRYDLIVESSEKTAASDPGAFDYWYGKSGPKKRYWNAVLLLPDNAPTPIKQIMDDWYERSRAYGDVGGCVIGEGFRFTWNGVDYYMSGQSPWQGSCSWESSIEQVADELRAIGAVNIIWEYGHLD